MSRLIYEMHCHTPLCRHADGTPPRYAEAAERRGLAGIVFTCHNPMPDSYGHSGRMREAEVDEYVRIVGDTRRRFEGQVDVRLGLECDYFPGYEDYISETLARMELHHVLGSVHPFLAIWRRRFQIEDDPLQTQRNYFDQLAASAESGMFDTISHPDLVKNMTANNWDFERLIPDVEKCLDRIAATGCAMELNTSGLLKTIPEFNPNQTMLQMMCQRDIPVVVGADAHVPERVSADFERAYDAMQSAGYTHVSYFLDRTRHELDINEARASLIPADSTV